MRELTAAELRLVLAVAREGSISAAAEALGWSQSALSRQVQAAESAAGAPLFDRLARGVRPTPAGEVLLRHAPRVLDALQAAHLELAGLGDRVAGRLALGAYPTVAAVLVPRAVARALHRHPGLDVRLHEGSSSSLVRRLRAGRLDAVVVAHGEGLPELALDGLRAAPVRTGLGLGIAVAAGHRLAALHEGGEVEVAELADEVWVGGHGADGAPQFGAWPTLADPRPGPSARDWTTRFGLVAAGLGIATVPGVAAAALPGGVRWLRVRDPAPLPARTTSVVVRGDAGPPARAVVAAVTAEAAVMAARAGAG